MNRVAGFTLLEILVAFAVLASGLSAIAFLHGTFNRMSAREATRADAVTAAIAYMERVIENPVPCADTLFVCASPACGSGLYVSQSHLDAGRGLQWLEVGAGPYVFRRLLRCVAVSR